MLIIVEGPDGVGKTTLVRKLAGYLGRNATVRVLKAGPPRGHPLDEYVLPLLDYRPDVLDGREHVICDRWHLGELVYPTVLDRPTRLSTPVLRYVEMFLAARGAVVAHVSDAPSDLERVLRDRGDDLVRPEQAGLMVDLFHRAVGESTLPVLAVEARDSSATTVESVVGYAMRPALAASRTSNFVTYVGTPYPRYLLVGDVRGVRRPGDSPDDLARRHGLLPAFLPYENTCGEYLLRAVTSALPTAPDRRLGAVGVVNANDVDNLYGVWSGLGRPHVVPLGRRAEDTVRHTLPLAARTNQLYDVPHPQYWKRFHYADHERYGKMITGSWEL
jgi:hypothetical protein